MLGGGKIVSSKITDPLVQHTTALNLVRRRDDKVDIIMNYGEEIVDFDNLLDYIIIGSSHCTR